MTDKTAYHPDGKTIITFNEEAHTYTDNQGQEYVSATSFINQFFPKFDAVAVSERCARGRNSKYAGRTPEDIREEWADNARQSSEEGTNVHEYAEGLLKEWESLPASISPRCERIFPHAEEAVQEIKKFYSVIAAEMIVFSPDLGIAGTIDLLLYDPVKRKILIADWKTNKEISREAFGDRRALAPIEHLSDTDISKYSLQLALYNYLLVREKYFWPDMTYDKKLIHLREDGFQGIPLEDHSYEIGEMLREKRK